MSTRRLREIAQELFGQEVSPTTVSRTTAYLDGKLARYQSQPLTDDAGILARDGFRLVTAFDALHPFGLPRIDLGVYRSAKLVSPAQEEVVSTVGGLVSDVHNRD